MHQSAHSPWLINLYEAQFEMIVYHQMMELYEMFYHKWGKNWIFDSKSHLRIRFEMEIIENSVIIIQVDLHLHNALNSFYKFKKRNSNRWWWLRKKNSAHGLFHLEKKYFPSWISAAAAAVIRYQISRKSILLLCKLIKIQTILS